MAANLPGTVRVKLSSEEAGAVSITPVVARELPTRDLVGLMLDFAGKDTRRIQDLLSRGTFVSGATRYRWQGWQASVEQLEALVASFPDPEPARLFAPERCVRVLLSGPGLRTEVSREALTGKSIFRRGSFWLVLLEVASEAGLTYAGYSYKEQADRYRLEIPPAGRERLRESAKLVRYSALQARVRAGSPHAAEFLVRRTD